MATLGIIWAFPLTAFGWVVAKLAGCKYLCQWPGDQRLKTRFYLHPTGGRLSWFFGRTYRGVTFGQVCICTETAMGVALPAHDFVKHEHAHTIQATRWGIFLAPAYGIASLISWIRCGSTWDKNYFELQAQEAEK